MWDCSVKSGFYQLEPMAPLGDFGHVLVHGQYVPNPFRKEGLYHRAGPDVPPLAMPRSSTLVVAGDALAPLTEIEPSIVSKTVQDPRLVRIDWRKICRTGVLPRRLQNCEPDEMLNDPKQVAIPPGELPVLHEVELAEGAVCLAGSAFGISKRSWRGDQLFAVVRYGTTMLVATHLAKVSLETSGLAEFIHFSPVPAS
jgi:hypothetical protein